MAFPDAIIVDYHAAIGGMTPVPLPTWTPERFRMGTMVVHCFHICRGVALLGGLLGESRSMEREFRFLLYYPSFLLTYFAVLLLYLLGIVTSSLKRTIFEIRLVTIQRPWNAGYGSLSVIENYTVQSGTLDFILTFHSNHRLIWHCFRDKRRFPLKIAKFSHPRVFIAADEGVPLELGIGTRRCKCFYDGATRWSKKFWDGFSRLDTLLAVIDWHIAVAKITLITDYYVARVNILSLSST